MRILFRNISVYEHDHWEVDIKYEDPIGTPFDFTGYSPLVKVRDVHNDKEIVDLTNDVTLSTGNIKISKTDTKSHEPGIYKYDVVIDDGTKQHTIVFGNFRIKPRYSQA